MTTTKIRVIDIWMIEDTEEAELEDGFSASSFIPASENGYSYTLVILMFSTSNSGPQQVLKILK